MLSKRFLLNIIWCTFFLLTVPVFFASEIEANKSLSVNHANRLKVALSKKKAINLDTVSSIFSESGGKIRVIVKTKPKTAHKYSLKSPVSRKLVQKIIKHDVEQVTRRFKQPNKIKLKNKFSYIHAFSAEVSLDGLEELIADDDVVAIFEDQRSFPALAQGISLMQGMPGRQLHGGEGVSIAILDTGIDYNHPALGGGGFPNNKVIGGFDTGEDDTDPIDIYGHGTAVAGIAAGNIPQSPVGDYIGGVAPEAKLYALKISAPGTTTARNSDIIEAIEWCITHQYDDAENPIKIINISYGGGKYFYNCDSFNADRELGALTVNNANLAGITIFASSGNDGFSNAIEQPACYSGVISVGEVYDADVGSSGPWSTETGSCTDSTTSPDLVTCYSNSSVFLTLLASGSHAYTLDVLGQNGKTTTDYSPYFNGTSAASPYAAGAAAIIQSASLKNHGDYFTPAELKNILTNSGDIVTDNRNNIQTPRINIEQSLLSEITPQITVTAGPNGSISPNGQVALNYGKNKSFLITPETGYIISSILVDGNPVSPVSPYTFFNVTSSHSIHADFELYIPLKYLMVVDKRGTGAGTVTSNPSGIDCGADCSNEYVEDEIVTLTASASPGSTFIGWSGACSCIDTCLITMDEAKSVTATFDLTLPSQHTLVVNKDGNGNGTISSSPSGINFDSGCGGASDSFDDGTLVTLTANAAFGSIFNGWSGVCSGQGICEVTMYDEKNVSAGFSLKTYEITASASAHGSIESAGTSPVNHGTSKTYSITPDAGYYVSSLLIDGNSVTPSLTYTFENIASPHTIHADFDVYIPTKYSVSISKQGTGNGTVISTPSGIDCGTTCNTSFDENTYVSLTPTPQEGSNFTGWSGDCTGTGTCDWTINADISGTAQFTLQTNPINATAIENGTIQPSGTVVVGYGLDQSFTMTPDEDYHVEKLYIDGVLVDSAMTYTFHNVVSSHTVSVEFARDLRGDVTGDFQVDLSDVITTLGVVSGLEVGLIAVGDVNEDNKVGLPEAIFGLRLLAGLQNETLSVNKIGSGSGAITSDPAGILCEQGCNSQSTPFVTDTDVVLTAIASEGSIFLGWSGACTGTNECQVTMNTSKFATAGFADENYIECGTSWDWVNPLPQGNTIKDIVWNGSMYVTIGDKGTILTSPDLNTWTTESPGTGADLASIAWNGEIFVVVSTNGPTLTSSDGKVWNTGSSNGYTLDVIWNNSQFVAVGASGIITTSIDGHTWISQTSNTTDWLTSIVWSGEQFVAVGWNGVIVTSSDGLTWIVQSSSSTIDLFGLNWNGTQYVAVGGDNTILTSTDGVDWVVRYSEPYGRLEDVEWDGNRYVAVGWSGDIFTSTNGVDWTPQSLGKSVILERIIWDGANFITVGDSGTVFTSADGITWSRIGSGETKTFSDITTGDNTMVAVGQDGIYTSPNGVSWTQRHTEYLGQSNIVWTGTQYIIVGGYGTVLNSLDGIIWTNQSLGTNDSLKGVASGNNLIIAVGQDGVIYTSPDAIAWTKQISGSSSDLNGVAWNGSLFVAAGDDGTIIASEDGVNWDLKQSGTDQKFKDVTWGNGQFVVVGWGDIYTSIDGASWTQQSSGASFTYTVTFNGWQFTVGDINGDILTSQEGVNWTTQETQAANPLYGVTWSGSQFIAVGFEGTMITSSDCNN